MDSAERVAAFHQFEVLVERSGVRLGFAYLLGYTNYRFVGIWRFHDGKVNAALHIDRQRPSAATVTEVPDNATHCCFVRDSRGVFMTANSLRDWRTEGHPARVGVSSYCGVPIMDEEGRIFGTLCHYDVVPRDPEQVDLELMLQVARYLLQKGLVPPYPQPRVS